MDKSENALSEILSNPEAISKISGIISSLSSFGKETDGITSHTYTTEQLCEKAQKMQKKIELIKAITPFLDEKAKQKADVIIAFLELAKQLANLQNDL